jgi:hypothetical protein
MLRRLKPLRLEYQPVRDLRDYYAPRRMSRR